MTTELPEHDTEPLEEGGTWLLDLVSAVDHLRRGIRPGITVCEAIEEALRWAAEDMKSADDEFDSLAGFIARADSEGGTALATMQTAIRRWVVAMADRYNDGYHWPHPVARRGFPPPSRRFEEPA